MTRPVRVTVIDRSELAAVSVAVIIPARNEAERIAACITSLAKQDMDRPPAIYLCVNNTTDDTAGIALDLARDHRIPMVVAEVEIARGGVGRARRIGHALAGRYGPATRTLLSTDADCVAAPAWARCMEEGLRRAPAVLGRIGMCEEDLRQFPEGFHARTRIEGRYAALSMEFERLLDPAGPDGIGLNTAGGANLGLRAEVYRRVGGFASLPANEDRELFDRILRGGYRPIRLPEALVRASMRLAGRARGGMSDAMVDRLTEENCALDIALAPFDAMLARHLGKPMPHSRLRRHEAEKDLSALADCVRTLRSLNGILARRAHLTCALAKRLASEPLCA